MLSGSYLGWRSSLLSSCDWVLVERRFFYSCTRWSFRLALISGKCLVIKIVASPGNVSKLLDLIAHRRVEGRELNSVLDRYLDKPSFVFWVMRAPLAWYVLVMAGGRGGVLVVIWLIIFAWFILVMSGGGDGGGVVVEVLVGCPKDHLYRVYQYWWLYCFF